MALYPLPRVLHPDFRLPGVKPVSAVDIDWSNPLSLGLKHCILLGDGAAVDLITGEHGVIGSNVARGVVGGEICDEATARDSNSVIAFTSPSILDIPKSNFSILMRTHGNGNLATSDDGCVAWGSTNNLLIYGFDSTNNGRVYWDTSMNRSVGTMDVDNWNDLVFVSRADNRQEMYLNGVLGYSDPLTVPRATYSYEHFNVNGSTNFGQYGNSRAYSLIYIYGRALSDDEVKALYLDRYSPLKPKTPIFYFTPEGAPPVSRRRFVITG